MKIILFLALSLAASAQTFNLAAPSAQPGAKIDIDLAFTGSTAAAILWDAAIPPELAGGSWTLSPALVTAGFTLFCRSGCVAYSLIGATIPAGSIATYSVTLSATASGPVRMPFARVDAVTAAGNAISAVAGPALTIQPASPCDVTGDGKIDASDVGNVVLFLTGSGGVGTPDVNRDGKVDLGDLQFVLNAVRTGTCGPFITAP